MYNLSSIVSNYTGQMSIIVFCVQVRARSMIVISSLVFRSPHHKDWPKFLTDFECFFISSGEMLNIERHIVGKILTIF
jgi:hypothetical protein